MTQKNRANARATVLADNADMDAVLGPAAAHDVLMMSETGAPGICKPSTACQPRDPADRLGPRGVVERILTAAARTPGANNSQPSRVRILTGPGRQRLTDASMTVRAAGRDDPPPERGCDLQHWPEPYLSCRRVNGWVLHGLLGTAKGDRDKGRAGTDGNQRFPTEREPVVGFAPFHSDTQSAANNGAGPHG